MNTAADSGSWQRQYSAHGSTGVAVVLVIIGVVFFLMGSAFAVIGFLTWNSGGPPLFALVGLLFALVGPALLGFAYYTYKHGKDVDIFCRADGFTVQTKSRSRGVEEQRYGWGEVTATDYTEEHYRSSRRGRGSRTTGYFAVQTLRGPAFRVTNSMGGFPDLINVFNQLTPQLPYVWNQQVGFNFSIGSIGRRLAYEQTARGTAGQMANLEVASGAPSGAASLPSAAPLLGGSPVMSPPAPLPKTETNTFGLLGLIFSGLGMFSCGLISPLGLILSLVGLFRPNKGLAIAGAVVGFIGTLILVFMGWNLVQGVMFAGERARTESVIEQASLKIITHRADKGSLPPDDEGQALVAGDRDVHGAALRYKRLAETQFELRSAGSDGKFETSDDVTRTGDGLPPKEVVPEAPRDAPVEPANATN